MSYQKNIPERDKKRLQNAKNCPICQHCNQHSETIVAAHYQGKGQEKLGKATRQKPSDLAVAYICQYCHDAFDLRNNEFKNAGPFEREYYFLMAIKQTDRWIANNG